MASLDPINSVLSLVNSSFTLAQIISGLKNASSEVARAIKFLATVQAQIQYTKDLRDRAFDVTSADTGRDETFLMVQTAIRNAQGITTSSSNTLRGSTKPVTEKGKDGAPPTTTTKTRFKWVLGGRSVYDGNLQELQVHYQTLMRATDVLQRRLAEMGQHPPPPALPFGEFELFTGTDSSLLSPGNRNGIYHLLGPRKSREMLREDDDDDGDAEEAAGHHDSGIGSEDVSDIGDDQEASGLNVTQKPDFTVLVLDANDDSNVDDVFLERLMNRRQQDGD